MTKIGVIGPSGSGKTAFAHKLTDTLEDFYVIDTYIPEFQEQTDWAVGSFGTYLVNTQIVIARLNNELQQQKAGHDYITCGTLIDSALYLAFNAAEISDNGDGTYEITAKSDMRTFASLYLFALIRQDSWNYDHVFYLPSKTDDQVAKTFDQEIDETLKTFHVEAIKLDQDTLEEQVQAALEVINVHE